MTGRHADRSRTPTHVSEAGDGGRRTGPHVGAVRVTPARVMLLIALVGGLAFLAYSIIVRDQLQIPLMATGFAICGLVFAATAAMGVAAVVRAGREGRDGTAVLTALLAGGLAIASLLSLAVAVIMSLIWSGTKGS